MLDVGAEQLDLHGRRLVVLDHLHFGDRAHQRADTVLEAVVALVGALEVGLADLVHDRLDDPRPGVGDQLVVDPELDQVERRDLDDVDQLAGLDHHAVAAALERHADQPDRGGGHRLGALERRLDHPRIHECLRIIPC